MTDLDRAIAAAREALKFKSHPLDSRVTKALRDLIAALDAARGEAVPDGYTSFGEFRWACDCDERMKREWIPLYAAPPAAVDAEEEAYVIDKLAKLLAEIAVIVNGVEPHDTLWSYHDLPEKVRALKQAQQPAAAVPEDAIEAAYWDFDARHKGYGPHKTTPQSERDAFKWAVRAMLAAAERKGGA